MSGASGDDFAVFLAVQAGTEYLQANPGPHADEDVLPSMNGLLSKASSRHTSWNLMNPLAKRALKTLKDSGLLKEPPRPAPVVAAPAPSPASPTVRAVPPIPSRAPAAKPAKVRVRMNFKYEGTEEGELSLQVGDEVEVEDQHESGWWVGRLKGGPLGTFPSNYGTIIAEPATAPPPAAAPRPHASPMANPFLAPAPAPAPVTTPAPAPAPAPAAAPPAHAQPSPLMGVRQAPAAPTPAIRPNIAPVAAAKPPKVVYAKCTNEYKAGEANELGLSPGDIVEVIKTHESGWWKGTLRGKTGIFPANFVELMPDEDLSSQAEKFRVEGADTEVAVGKVGNFGIRRSDGRLTDLPDAAQFEVTVIGPSHSVSTKGQVRLAGNGIFAVAFIPTELGNNVVVIKLGGQEVNGSRFLVQVVPEGSGGGGGGGSAPPFQARKTTAAAPRPTVVPPAPQPRGAPIPRSNTSEVKIFGVSLAEAVGRSVLPGDNVPAIVRRSIEYIEAMGLRETGIYRLSGSLAQVRDYKAAWDRGEDVDYMGTCKDPHVVAGLLKQYLRELPDKVAPELTGDENDLPALRAELHQLPPANFALLAALSHHYFNVQANSEINAMPASNVAICLCPTLFLKSTTFKAMITHPHELFN
jgi:hypothetical protein